MLYGEIIAVFFSDPRKTHEYAVWAECRILLMLNVVVHIVTTGLYITETTNLELQLVGNYVLQLYLCSKSEGKFCPRTGHEGPEVE
jgi:hypothetical protein